MNRRPSGSSTQPLGSAYFLDHARRDGADFDRVDRRLKGPAGDQDHRARGGKAPWYQASPGRRSHSSATPANIEQMNTTGMKKRS